MNHVEYFYFYFGGSWFLLLVSEIGFKWISSTKHKANLVIFLQVIVVPHKKFRL
jgi:hypothetical protein